MPIKVLNLLGGYVETTLPIYKKLKFFKDKWDMHIHT